MITRTALVVSYDSCLAARTEAPEWAWDTGEGRLGVTWGQRYVSVVYSWALTRWWCLVLCVAMRHRLDGEVGINHGQDH